jgi:hypothetical protein
MPCMRRTLAACLAAVALTGLAACADEPTTVAETGTTSTTAASSSTSEAVGGNTDSTGTDGSSTTESTTADSGSSSSSSSTPVGTSSSTTEPADVADTPEDAAGGLFGAWQAGDESAVPAFVDQAAADALFAEDATAFADAEDQGCTADDPATSWACSWSTAEEVLTMRVEGSDADGWRVVSVTFGAAD